MKIDEKKGIVSLVKNDFTPLEESKEGLLKGGFGSVIPPGEGPTPFSLDNCRCNKGRDNCPCPNSGCAGGGGKGNNCYCGTTTTPPPKPITTTPPPAPTAINLMGFEF